ncbi:hypothetical protein LPS12_004819 [Salmonella enterica]|nr:hypothetical protein [Salmonella enterica]
MEHEFDSSNFELASDYSWHLMQKEGKTETDALMQAAHQYNINYVSLQGYWDQA